MKIEKNRHLLILDALFVSNDPITAEKLAALSRSSVRTIKTDISLLNKQLIDEKLAKIVSSREGYEIEITDKDNFEKFSEEVKAMKRLYYNRQIEETNRRLYIAQRILTDEYVLIDDLCESLYVSRTLVSKDLEWVKYFLESYDIEIKSVSGKGLVIAGKEISIRNAMVEIHYSQFYDYQQSYIYEPFNKLFYEDKTLYEDIRREFLNLIRTKDIPISDLSSKSIPTYMCLVLQRVKSNKLINISEDKIEELKKTTDFKIIQELANNPKIGHYFDIPEVELVNLARLLLVCRDFDLRSKGLDDISLSYIKENAALYNKVLKKAGKKLGKSLYNVEFYRFIELDVQSLQLQLYLKNRFSTTKKKRLVTYVERDESLLSPIPLEMARIMVGCLQEEFGQSIQEPVVTAYAAYFEHTMKKIIYPYHQLKLLTTATEGLVYSRNIKESLLLKYGSYIREIDAYNLYEMRKLNFEDYDAVIHSGNLMYYKYPMKCIEYDEIDYQKDEESELKELLKSGYDRTRINQIKKIVNVYENVSVDNPDFFMESLFYRYTDNEDNRKALKNDYYNKRNILDYYSSRQMSLLVMMDYKYVKKEVIDIFILDKPAEYHGSLETRFIVMVSLNPDNDVSSLKIDNYVLQCINQISGVVERISKNKEKELDDIYDSVITI